MHDLTPNYWNNRYKTDDFGWDIGAASTPLKCYIEQLKNKDLRILIPGAGNAYEAELLYKLGFKNSYVLDFAETPLKNFKNRFPHFPDEQLIQQDFFEHQNRYDLILEQTFFCALNPNLRLRYAKHMNELLNANGKLVGLLFNDALNKDHPPFGGSTIEYINLFNPYFEIKQFANCYNSIKPREGREIFMTLLKK